MKQSHAQGAVRCAVQARDLEMPRAVWLPAQAGQSILPLACLVQMSAVQAVAAVMLAMPLAMPLAMVAVEAAYPGVVAVEAVVARAVRQDENRALPSVYRAKCPALRLARKLRPPRPALLLRSVEI